MTACGAWRILDDDAGGAQEEPAEKCGTAGADPGGDDDKQFHNVTLTNC